MSEAQTESRPDVSLLQQAVNVFLKDAMPHLSLTAVADATIRSVTRFIPGGLVSGSLWRPGQRPNTRFRLALEGDTVVHRESAELDLPPEELKPAAGPEDDVRILLHRSLKSLTMDRPGVDNLRQGQYRAAIEIRFCYFGRLILFRSEDDVRILLHRSLKSLTMDRPGVDNLRQGQYRAAIEIRFCYFGRLILLLIIGLPTAKGLINKEGEDFLNLFCRCCLITLQGAYIAEMEEKSERSSGLLLHEKFSLTLHWFHSIT